MRIVFSFLLPPLAVLLCGEPLRAVLNVLLTCCFWIPGVVHALVVVWGYHHEQGAEETAKRMEEKIAEHRPEARLALKGRRKKEAAKNLLTNVGTLAVVYVLSIGPAEWLARNGYGPAWVRDALQAAYSPLLGLAQQWEWFGEMLNWYRRFWIGS